MKKVKLALGIHNHQPVGNFEFVFEEAYQNAYLPFLSLLERHPKIKVAMHFTGVLFQWILDHDADFGPRLRKMVKSGQIEMMSGGYYEPILINIPDVDKFGQIEKLNQFVKKHTGYEPKGLWLAERIWEPQLPKPLAKTGAKYVVIDDSHFKTAGLEEKDLFGYYITEETGHLINIFPISERLRYTIPFQEPEETINYLRSVANDDGSKLVVFADDGEKFGNWPNTYKHCYEDRWLDRFFSALEDNLDWIELVHFSEALEKLPPAGRVYLPTASYREMMEWALPTDAITRYENFEEELKNNELFDEYKVFVRGGFWRNFLAKYPEANNMHKKSLRVSQKIQQVKRKESAERQKLFEQAQDNLWAGQTNCPYWHGIFGGLYLNNLRYAVYHHMIRAEAIADKLIKTKQEYEKGWIDTEVSDANADGLDEVIIETKDYNLYFSPHSGGTLFEMDYKPKAINLLDTMTRRKEAYHQKLLELANDQNKKDESTTKSIHDIVQTKEPDLHKKIKYDWYQRVSFIDHFLEEGTQLPDMANAEYRELGDFVNSPYSFKFEKNILKLYRNGTVIVDRKNRKVTVAKKIHVSAKGSELISEYEIINLEDVPVELWFGAEFNFALLAGNAPDRYYYFDQDISDEKHLASSGELENITKMGLKDEWLKLDIQLTFNEPTTVWRFPVETISQSEGGFERVYQSSVVFPNWKFRLDSWGTWKAKITQKVFEI